MQFSSFFEPISRQFGLWAILFVTDLVGYNFAEGEWFERGLFFRLLPIVLPVLGSIVLVKVGIRIFKKVTGKI